MINITDLWRNGSASGSSPEGCLFKSRQGDAGFTMLLFLAISLNSISRYIGGDFSSLSSVNMGKGTV